ncbi:MAG TPA: acetylglutamate kinase [Polyangiaceae bacterium]|jgi:acetylglutamate kinase|nr:acetylglutamate kinase [Polyangiaceae bacterium]
MQDVIEKASVLHEALPYIRRFHGRTFVIKYGGHAMVDADLKASFARDICLLRYVGIHVVVVHGGGPQINAALGKMGVESHFVSGLRITDEQTMDVVEMVLAGQINQEIVGLICMQGGRAVGLSGKDDTFIRARRMGEVKTKSDRGEVMVDPGLVGEITEIVPDVVDHLVRSGFVPVISPIGVDRDGQSLNINADTAAGKVAEALRAEKLILLTDVEAVRSGEGQLIRSLTAPQAAQLIEKGVIHSGMIPKVQCGLDALAGGVKKVHMLDGRVKHAVLLEIFTDQGIGTEISR